MSGKIARVIHLFINVLLGFASIFFIIGTIITFVNVIFRKGFDKSWTGMEDFNAIMLMTLIYLPLVYLEWTGKQLSLSLFYDRYCPLVKKIVKTAEHVVILIFSLVIIKGAWEVVLQNYQMGTKLASLQIPVYIPYSVILVGFIFVAIIKLIHLFIPSIGGEVNAH
ncbi:TRAP transporter small permease [Bacillus canaveralius]|uniref:TRAP transporter small permease n=1 Tax=Bacillus canaveralius TaxID=1403243 RepID=UPI000F777D78|nr:TRAP transporter small permease [Bacillus canaveralius]RSK55135.1 TRAP transporter small permease [Bacillus canaveralius]